MIPTFGFDELTSVRVPVNLNLAWLPDTGSGLNGWSTTAARLWIKQADHVRQAVTVLGE